MYAPSAAASFAESDTDEGALHRSVQDLQQQLLQKGAEVEALKKALAVEKEAAAQQLLHNEDEVKALQECFRARSEEVQRAELKAEVANKECKDAVAEVNALKRQLRKARKEAAKQRKRHKEAEEAGRKAAALAQGLGDLLSDLEVEGKELKKEVAAGRVEVEAGRVAIAALQLQRTKDVVRLQELDKLEEMVRLILLG